MAVSDLDSFEVIAERSLEIVQGNVNSGVLVQFSKPVPSSGDWTCAYRVLGIGDGRVHRVMGIDSVQALQLAMYGAYGTLTGEFAGAHLTFLDETDLGFPTNLKDATGSCPYCREGAGAKPC